MVHSCSAHVCLLNVVPVCAVFPPELRLGGLEPQWWVAREVPEGKSQLCLGVLSRDLR